MKWFHAYANWEKGGWVSNPIVQLLDPGYNRLDTTCDD